MTNIRRPDWKDLLRVPVFDMGEDGKIIVPSNEGIPSWGPYSLVAEAPGKNMMGFVSTSIHKDEDTSALIGSIDKCRVNRLYEQVEPMKGLVSGMENVLCGEKVISRVEACFPEDEGSISQTLKYEKLGYHRISAPDKSMITLSKYISQAQEAVQAQDAVGADRYASRVAHVGEAVGQVAAAEQYTARVAHVGQAVGQVAAAAAEEYATGMTYVAEAMLEKMLELDVTEQRDRQEAREERAREERARRASREETGSQEETSTSYAPASETETETETSTSYAPTLPRQLPKRRR